MIYGLAERHYADLAKLFGCASNLECVLIFGSRAKGTAKPWSDFDLAVIAPNMSDAEFARLWTAVEELPLVFKFDLLHWVRLENANLRAKILEEGMPFFPLPYVGTFPTLKEGDSR